MLGRVCSGIGGGVADQFAGCRVGNLERRIGHFAALQTFDKLDDDVESIVDVVDQLDRCGAGVLRFLHACFDGMRQVAEIHRASHARAALETVEQACQPPYRLGIGGVAAPGAQLCRDVLVEVNRLLDEQWQQLFVELVLDERHFRRGGGDRRGERRCRHDDRRRLGEIGGHLFLVRGRRRLEALVDGQLRVQRIEGREQAGDRLGLMFPGHVGEHQCQFGDRLPDGLDGLETVATGGMVPSHECQLQCVAEMLDDCQADRSRDAGEGVRGAVHFMARRCRQVAFEQSELALQGGEVGRCLIAEDADQCRCDRQAGTLRRGRRLHRDGGCRRRRLACGCFGDTRRGDGATGNAQYGIVAFAQGCRQCTHAADVGHFSEPGLEMLDPGGECCIGLPEEVEELRCHLQLLSQPEVEDLLNRPRRLSQLLEADHPPAALEGVDRAPESGQNLDVVRLLLEQLQVVVDAAEDLVRLLEEDPQQLGVYFLRRRLRELDGFCGGWWRERHFGLEGRHRRVDLWCGIATGSQRREHMLRLLSQFLVGNQIGILLQCRQVLRHLLPQRRIARLFLECDEQGVCFTLLLLDLLLDRCHFGFGLLWLTTRPHAADESLEVRGARLHGVDEETDQRQLLGQTFEVGLLWFVTGIREACDFRRAVTQDGDRALMAHHRQGTDDLPQRCIELYQITSPVGVAEEAVEHLLDLREVVRDLTRDLADEHLFLRLARHFVESRQFRLGRQRCAGDAVVDPGGHHVDLVREAAVQVLEVLLCILGKEDGRRALHRQRFAVAHRRLPEEAGDLGDRPGQAQEVGLSGLLGDGHKRCRVGTEDGQRLRGTCREAVPRLFGGGDRVAQTAPDRILGDRCQGDLSCDQGRQPVGLLDLLHRSMVASGDADQIQRVAHQAFGDVARTLQQAPGLQVDASAQLLGIGIRG
ncbi:MAG: hypothetical protein FAZ92_02401 [Accumulibacter sp.]|nr:MAG: hypothetical protein FAZ92_02401 [Accumulibacter sp.]